MVKKTMTKKELDALKKKISRKPVLVWDCLSTAEEKKVFQFADKYKSFLDVAKTERKTASLIAAELEKSGFQDITTASSGGNKLYRIFRNKVVAAAVIGKSPVSDGLNIIASHIDSPRLDLKQNPLYEEVDLAMMKIHYYGGIRKYQWLARPLAMHGKIIMKNGQEIDIEIGEDDNDPVFTISDLLPHLARKLQAGKKLAQVFPGEKLNLIAGSMPVGDLKIKERFKLNVLKYLYEKFKMVEGDFISAEIEVVPAGRARDVGFDRSLIGAYGQDDRICAFTSLKALQDLKNPDRTGAAFFYDKEEIGSEGNTGAKSRLIEDFISDLLAVSGQATDERTLRKALFASSALSADVNGALDPDFQEVHEKRNAARLGHGICITKFTGSGGKSGANDASAEYVGRLRKVFNDSRVVWQTGELGKVDEGGGGTVAKYLAEYGLEIVDCGPALLAMHSPMEISSKGDVYMTYKAYKAFFSSKG